MDLERPHFRTTSTGSSSSATTTTTTGELFICFTSRLSASSSSMKLTKSILSPGRAARDGGGGGPVSLSSSLSRRLRTNGSLKGGASPFFTSSTTGKKRGCAFENPEPSSPKVTCIGQVRVKTKKKVKQSRSLSKRRSGEVMSFRKIEHGNSGDRDHHQSQEQRYSNASGGTHYQHQQQQQQPECLPLRNQRWVHLPISICEALSCLFPCKSSCFSTAGGEETEKAAAAAHEKHNDTAASGDENGCGAVFARWLVSVNDGEGGKRREIELVVGGGDEEERVSMRSSRRHVFEDFEVKDDRIEVKGQINEVKEEEEEGGREDIKEEEEENNEVVVVSEEEECDQGNTNEVFEQQEEEVSMEQVAAEDIVNGDEELVIISSIDQKMIDDEEEEKEIEELQQEILGNLQMFSQEEEEEEEEEVESNMSSFEHLLDQENADHYQESNCPIGQHEEEEEVHDHNCHLSSPSTTESDEEINVVVQSNEEAEESMNISDKVSILEIINDGQEHQIELEPAQITTHSTENGVQEQDEEEEDEEEQKTVLLQKESEMVENREIDEPVSKIEEEEEPNKKVLPECLLLMMCEPKLSMEVSKETWVCSTDFVRWLPERPRKPAKSAKSGGGCDHAPPPKRRLSIDSKLKPVPAHAPPSVAEDGYRYQHYQPPRSSCSLPAAAAAASMATMIEQKLVNAVGYEPFVLTRCKSEPMRSAAAKLIPESCFWKNAVTKLEPHGRAALGVGAAGVGF
ncbi:hypothetical protein MIMGU_mgv1a001920mg [Erythranthe guttata]|uniref:Uncharacterized protein n=1 Tax=Erythranthe guttata TaxID=4155 RepID=A0A022RZ82_ERYGU|nr:hypothetical protein MIMGU_mgv1a001920mg [Erythranthe guttata]